MPVSIVDFFFLKNFDIEYLRIREHFMNSC